MRHLTAQQRKILALFLESKRVTAKNVAAFLTLSQQSASDLCVRWLKQGFFELANSSKKARSYALAARYETLISKRSRARSGRARTRRRCNR